MALNRKQRAQKAVELLKKEYPEAKCSLEYKTPYELLFSTRLSAQCTDKRVNEVTKVLFSEFRSLEEFADADILRLEDIVKPCGFFHVKARDIKDMSVILLQQYNGIVPDTIDELVKLPGVGRKTANLVVGDIYGKPAVVCDTHCIRITNLLGISEGKNPLIVERQLREVLPPDESNDFCHRLVMHGREVCRARNAACSICCLNSCCAHAESSPMTSQNGSVCAG